jgi:hypothetical protein
VTTITIVTTEFCTSSGSFITGMGRTDFSRHAQQDGPDSSVPRSFFGTSASRELVAKSAAVLVFPSAIKAGIWIGDEYGEGALLTRGRTLEYYNTYRLGLDWVSARCASAIGYHRVYDRGRPCRVQTRQWLKCRLRRICNTHNCGCWGLNRHEQDCKPHHGFIFDGKGLMYNLTLDGSKISRIAR